MAFLLRDMAAEKLCDFEVLVYSGILDYI